MVVAVLVLDTLAGFSLIMDQGRTIKVFNSDNMGMGLIVLNVSCLILQVVVAIVVEWKLYKKCNTRQKVYSKCCCCIVSKRKGNEKSKSKKKENRNTVIDPAGTNSTNDTDTESAIDIVSLRSQEEKVPEETSNEDFNTWNDDDDDNTVTKKPSLATISMINQIAEKKPSLKTDSIINKNGHNTAGVNHSILNDAQVQHRERTILLSNHRRKLKKQTTLKVQQRRQAQILLKHTKGLRNTEIFKDCTDEQLKIIIDAMTLKIFLGGETIVKEKDVGDSFMVLVKGTADIFKEGHGKINTLDTTAHKRMIGETALIETNHIRSASVIATGEYTQVLVLTRTKYLELKNNNYIQSNTDDNARRASMTLRAVDQARGMGYTSKKKATITAPPISSSTLPNAQEEESFGEWDDDDKDNNAVTATNQTISPRMSMIQRPTPSANRPVIVMQQKIKFANNGISAQRKRAQTLLKHTRVLKNATIFQDCDDHHLKIVCDAMNFKIFNKNDYIVKEGDDGQEFFVIMSGTANVFKKNVYNNGKDELINTVGLGCTHRMLGEGALIEENHVRSASVVAVGDNTQVLILTRETYNSLKIAAVVDNKSDQRARRISQGFIDKDKARGGGGGGGGETKVTKVQIAARGVGAAMKCIETDESDAVKVDHSQTLAFS